MVNTRRPFRTLLFCWAFAAAAVWAQTTWAQTTLTQIRDTVLNTDGTPFNGTVIITWNGFTGSNGGALAPLSTSARIYDGALSVLLVPTTTASPGTFYQAVYYTATGAAAWTETWQVPPSTTALALSVVKTSTTQGSSGSSGSGGASGSGGGGSSGTGTSVGAPYATLPIALNQVSGLSADLAAMNASIASVVAQLSSFGAVGSGSSASFIDAETPAGNLDGVNGIFTLSHTPSPVGSVSVYRNGLLQTVGVDYTLNGPTINFLPSGLPKSTDVVNVFYRIAGNGPAASFADSEVPAGTIEGVNSTFTLINAPTPSLSLELFKNGVLLTQNNDYTLSGKTIVFGAKATPQIGDLLLASYRH